jgi:hypothetical protein
MTIDVVRGGIWTRISWFRTWIGSFDTEFAGCMCVDARKDGSATGERRRGSCERPDQRHVFVPRIRRQSSLHATREQGPRFPSFFAMPWLSQGSSTASSPGGRDRVLGQRTTWSPQAQNQHRAYSPVLSLPVQ